MGMCVCGGGVTYIKKMTNTNQNIHALSMGGNAWTDLELVVAAVALLHDLVARVLAAARRDVRAVLLLLLGRGWKVS